VTAEAFEKLYRDTAVQLTLASLDYAITPGPTNPANAEMGLRGTYHTNLLGDLAREMKMPLVNRDGQWLVAWSDALVMPETANGNRLWLELSVPERGEILDRDGVPIAYKEDAVSLGIQPGLIPEDRENEMLGELSRLTGKTREAIKLAYEGAAPDWYIAVGETTADAVAGREDYLASLGVIVNRFTARYYPNQGTAPHVVGYVLSISPEDLESYRRQGFRMDELVGASGLEKWGEPYLMGGRGASLYVMDAKYQVVTRLAQVDERPAQNITTTLYANLQVAAQNAIKDYRGAVVVLERDTGRLLAMASSPGFDPNINSAGNYNQSAWVQRRFDAATNRLLLNRATQGLYPLGSVFKIITMAAALESGDYTPESTYACGLHFTELPGVILNDWTFDHGLMASGLLTLPEGLMRSCNPWFWHIGLNLYLDGKTRDVYNMADAFGRGHETGIGQVMEAPGNLPIPENDGDAVNQAIGQGQLMVTPLQVARFIAAVGNGGTLYRPQLVEKVVPPGGQPSYTFKPEAQGTPPVSAANLKVIQDALVSVVADRRGTAHFVLANIPYVAGKTGTAQTPGVSHAWFAGYTFAGLAG
jgi:penicillin-binding protein 2